MATKLSKEQKEELRKALLARESSNNYKAVNKLGYVGGYQMSAATLETLGYLKKGASKKGNKAVNNPANWTGKNGLNSLDDFFNNPKAQDKAFEENLNFNSKVLTKLGTINKDTTPEDFAGFLAASHLLGAGGASKDLTAEDANKVSGTKYFNLGKQAVASLPTPPSKTQERLTPQQMEQAVIPQGISMSPADIRNYRAERDIRNYDGMEPGVINALAKTGLENPLLTNSLDDLVNKLIYQR